MSDSGGSFWHTIRVHGCGHSRCVLLIAIRNRRFIWKSRDHTRPWCRRSSPGCVRTSTKGGNSRSPFA